MTLHADKMQMLSVLDLNEADFKDYRTMAGKLDYLDIDEVKSLFVVYKTAQDKLINSLAGLTRFRELLSGNMGVLEAHIGEHERKEAKSNFKLHHNHVKALRAINIEYVNDVDEVIRYYGDKIIEILGIKTSYKVEWTQETKDKIRTFATELPFALEELIQSQKI